METVSIWVIVFLLVTILFSASCGGGGSTSNLAPTADAGTDQIVDEGTEVLLKGSGTDSDGMIESYSWVQTEGKTITLSSAQTQTIKFISPYVEQEKTLTFQLTVTDDEGATATDTVQITVNNSDPLRPTPLRETAFIFGDKVSEETQKLFQDTALLAMRYIRDETDTVLNMDLIYYGFIDRENFINAYVEFHNYSAEREAEIRKMLQERREIFGYDFWGTFDGSAVFIYSTHFLDDRRRLLHVIAHEHYHAIQTLGIVGSDGIRHIGPEWLIEGSARYVEAWTLDQAGEPLEGQLTDYRKTADIARVKGFTGSLRSIAPFAGFFSPDRTELEILAAYSLGRLAAELLADNYGGLEAVTQFYRAIDEDTTWQEAFEDTFGISVDDFYTEFEEYRAEITKP